MEKKNAIKLVIIVFVVCMLSVISWFIYNKVYESFAPGMPMLKPTLAPFNITEVPLDSAMQYFIYDSRVNTYFPVSKAMRYRYRLPSTSPGPSSTAYTDVIVYFAETDADILVVSDQFCGPFGQCQMGIVRYVIGKFDEKTWPSLSKSWPSNPKFLSFPNNVSVFLEVRFPQSYPLISLNSNFQNGYTVSASSSFTYKVRGRNITLQPWQAFDNNNNTIWHSAASVYARSNYTGRVNTIANNIRYTGEWLQIRLPVSIKVQSFIVTPRKADASGKYSLLGAPLAFMLLGSPNGTRWNVLYTNTNINWPNDDPQLFTLSNISTAYNIYRLVFNRSRNDAVCITDWKLNETKITRVLST